MRLTAMDINNKEFKKAIRGYNVDEVDEFLDKIGEDYEELYKENSTMKEKLSSLNERVDHYSKIEATIQNTLLLAQNAAEQVKASSQKEAELVVKSANDAAQRILDKAHNDVLQINDDYEKLKQEFVKFRSKFKNFMKAQMDTFEDLENDFVKNYSIGKVFEERTEKQLEEQLKEKEIQENNFNLKDVNEDVIRENDLNAIKSFFVKE
jgi:cell division initiation protein